MNITTTSNSDISGKKGVTQKKKPAPQHPAPEGEWKCVTCGCPEHLTPVKRLGPDGMRNICNACYIKNRAQKERTMKGSARPNVNRQSPYQYTSVSPTATYAAYYSNPLYFGQPAYQQYDQGLMNQFQFFQTQNSATGVIDASLLSYLQPQSVMGQYKEPRTEQVEDHVLEIPVQTQEDYEDDLSKSSSPKRKRAARAGTTKKHASKRQGHSM